MLLVDGISLAAAPHPNPLPASGERGSAQLTWLRSQRCCRVARPAIAIKKEFRAGAAYSKSWRQLFGAIVCNAPILVGQSQADLGSGDRGPVSLVAEDQRQWCTQRVLHQHAAGLAGRPGPVLR